MKIVNVQFTRLQTIIAVVVSALIGLALGVVPVLCTENKLIIHVSGELGAPVTADVHGRIADQQEPSYPIKGTGRQVSEGSQVLFTVSSYAYTSGGYLTVLADTTLKATTASAQALGDLFPILDQVREGTRAVAIFPDTSGASAEIVVIDVLPTVISGEPQSLGTIPAGVSVGMDDAGLPLVSASGSAFAALNVSALIAGEGEQVPHGAAIYANYVITNSSGEVLESTYTNPMPSFLETSKIFTGLGNAIVDQRVGSRVVATIPSTQARGSGDLIIVVDILALAPEGYSAADESTALQR